jgi:predicted RNA-binding protein with PUA domain
MTETEKIVERVWDRYRSGTPVHPCPCCDAPTMDEYCQRCQEEIDALSHTEPIHARDVLLFLAFFAAALIEILGIIWAVNR